MQSAKDRLNRAAVAGWLALRRLRAAGLCLVLVVTACRSAAPEQVVPPRQVAAAEPKLLNFRLVRETRTCLRDRLAQNEAAQNHGLMAVAKLTPSYPAGFAKVALVRGSGSPEFDAAVLQAAELCEVAIDANTDGETFEVEIASGDYPALRYR